MLDDRFWNKYFSVYDVLNLVIPYQDLMENLEKELSLDKDDIVLDLGSGTGNLYLRLKGKVKEIIGVDNSLAGINLHKKKDKRANVICQDIRKTLPFKDEYFTKVVANNVIYTFNQETQKKMMLELYRVMKPCGKIVISDILKTFNPLSIYKDHIKKSIHKNGVSQTFLLAVKMFVPTLKMFYYNIRIKKSGITKDYNLFTEEEHKRILEIAGFKNVSKGKFLYSNQAVMHSAVK
jgi:ubiquinone/menaquinone biosynthesis C-methylase UbiE